MTYNDVIADDTSIKLLFYVYWKRFTFVKNETIYEIERIIRAGSGKYRNAARHLLQLYVPST